jgi:hypothetical protein
VRRSLRGGQDSRSALGALFGGSPCAVKIGTALLAALLAVAAAPGCGEPSNRPPTDPTIPIGVWEVADVDASAQELLVGHRAAAKANPALTDSDSEILADAVADFRHLLLDFRADGTVVHSDRGPWDVGRWVRRGDEVVVTVDRYGDVNGPLDIPYRVDGNELSFQFAFDSVVELRRSTRTSRSLPSPPLREATTRPDLDAVLNALLPFAQQMLAKHGEFFPFGASMSAEGEVAAVAAEPGEAMSAAAVIEMLEKGFRETATAGGIRAAGICYDARLRERSGDYRYGTLFATKREPTLFR